MSGARPSMRLVAYQGLILDFGGVITTDFYACLSAFCVREGLAPDAVTHALSAIPEARGVFAAAEVISAQVGVRKPEPSSYDLTAAKLGLGPEDCVFVDDTPANLVTARHLGMATVHFTGAPSDFAEIERLLGIESLCRLRPANWSLTRHDSCSREETDG